MTVRTDVQYAGPWPSFNHFPQDMTKTVCSVLRLFLSFPLDLPSTKSSLQGLRAWELRSLVSVFILSPLMAKLPIS